MVQIVLTMLMSAQGIASASGVGECAACSQPSFGPAMSAFTTRLEGPDRFFAAFAKNLAVGDFNNDGIPDLAVNGVELKIFTGTGSGSYRRTGAFPYPDPRAIATGDFNADGNLDLALAAQGALYVLLGDGDGSFPVGVPWIDLGVEEIAVGDFNGDGILDLATAGFHGNEIRVYRGAGGGTFSLAQRILVGSGVEEFEALIPLAADLNGDGIDDLAVSSAPDAKIGILLGNSTGPLTVIYTPTFGFSGGDLRAGDFDEDGHIDLLAVSKSNYFALGSLTFLHGAGDGTFQVGNTFPVGFFVLETGDFDGDGRLDVALIKAYDSDTQTYGLFVYPGTGQGTFGTPVRTLLPTVNPIAAADLNLDGRLDLAMADQDADSVTAILGQGNGHFEEARRISARVQGIGSIGTADFNNDSKPDVVITGVLGDGQLAILLGAGSGELQSSFVVSVPGISSGHAVADFNHDGKMDVAVSTNSNDLYVFPGKGNGSLGDPIRTVKDFGVATMAAGDFDQDGNPDIVLSLGAIMLLRGNGDGTFQAPSTISPLTASRLEVADVNGDGHRDVAFTTFIPAEQTSMLAVLPGNGNGTFAPEILSPIEPQPGPIAFGDMNGDGKLDLVVEYPNVHEVDVVLGDGGGSFTSTPLHADVDGYFGTIALADFTGDGLLDAALDSQHHLAVLPGTGGGQLGQASLFTTPGIPNATTVGDFDGNGKPDVVVACYGSVYTPPDFVVVFRNTSCEARRLVLASDVNACGSPGATFPVEPVLRTLDDGDNLVTCAGGSVSAAIVRETGTPGASLLGSTSATVVDGTAAFTNLAIDLAGPGYRLQFSHPTAGTSRTPPFTVGAPPPVSISGPASFCSAGSFGATPGFDTYVWSVDGAVVGTRIPVVLDGHALGRGPHTLGVRATKDECDASTSIPIQVTLPDVTITAPATVCPHADSSPVSAPDAGPGATYDWTITNGLITSGVGTHTIQFRAGPEGNVILSVTIADSQSCSETGSRTVAIDRTGCPVPVGFFTVEPCRVLDTRDPDGAYGGPALSSATSRTFAFAGRCGIPADATAVAVNITVAQPTNTGHLTVFPGGTPPPVVSTINYRPGQTRANNAIVALGAAGDLVISCSQFAGTTHVLVDVTGYFR